MPTRFRPGTGQLGITGIPTEMIEEYKKLCKGRGQNGRNLSLGEMFEIMFAEWKSLTKLRDQGQISLAELESLGRQLGFEIHDFEGTRSSKQGQTHDAKITHPSKKAGS